MIENYFTFLPRAIIIKVRSNERSVRKIFKLLIIFPLII